ncbi:hypothetical protein TGAMA5MH_03192 [Trichoderma gamsii]|uniref:Uncharacterized protein n=1 Tax=Trichoderma gamsii TaxID=398673 RepID=A0A2K0THX8_9HYPO|nr:hypothetical protein TGAMA5MH_03192 [Trichoderma gamsii]
MGFAKYVPLLLLAAKNALADTPIAVSDFTENGGLAAAQAAAPMWYMPSGTCMPSAAEDGEGNQTNGVDTDNCNINALANGCPVQPAWQGANTFYGNVSGEPFVTIPTYWASTFCNGDSSGSDASYRIIYYVYFKKDTGHKSDWEGIVVRFTSPDGGNTYTRESVIMEQDGNHVHISWSDVNDTFEGDNDWQNFSQKNLDHGKFYFGKFHHSVHQDWYTSAFKNTCPPLSADDYRNDDYQFWAYNNLRPVSVLNPNWVWGKADSPANIDICSY